MKNQLLILSIAFLTLTNIYAQDKGDFELGANIGLNLANVSTIDGQNSTKSRFSFNAGVSGEYYFSDRWGIKMKLIYDSKGWTDGFIIDENQNMTTTDFNLNYVSIPIMANLHFGSRRNWYLNFGPYIGLLASAEDTVFEMDLKDTFKSTDFGFAYGIGYKIEINSSTKLFIEYEAQSGFLDVFEENLGDAVRNGRSSLNFGALFML